jgi:hypothetical protein
LGFLQFQTVFAASIAAMDSRLYPVEFSMSDTAVQPGADTEVATPVVDDTSPNIAPTAPEPQRRFVPTYRQRQEAVLSVDTIVTRASSVMEKMATTSISEVEGLIRELEQLRDFLRQESGRIQREIEGYARLSEEATKSTRIIAESVVQWKNALESIAGRRL